MTGMLSVATRTEIAVVPITVDVVLFRWYSGFNAEVSRTPVLENVH